MNIKSEISFLRKLRHEYQRQPDDYPKNVVDDLIDLGVRTNSMKAIDFDKHFINQINNRINLLKHSLKTN